MRLLLPLHILFAIRPSERQELSRTNVDCNTSRCRELSSRKPATNAIERNVQMAAILAFASFISLNMPDAAVGAPDVFEPSRLAGSNVFRPLPREEPFLWSDSAISSQDRATLNELNRLRKLEDQRLEECRDQGVDWESCFVYGIGGRDANKESKLNGESASMKQRPPTW